MFDALAMQKCLTAFITRDYDSCARQAWELLTAKPSHEVFQLMLISLQRFDKPDDVQMLAPIALEAAAHLPWYTALLRLTLGEVQLREVLALARNEVDRSQAHYYAGARLLTFGQHDDARAEFDASLATRADCLEFKLAALETKSLSPSRKTAESAGVGRIIQLNQQVARLVQEERYKDVIAPATQLCELVKQFRGESHPDYGACIDNLAGFHLRVGNLDKAEVLYKQAVKIRRIAMGENHLEFAQSLFNLANLYEEMQSYAKAIELYQQVVDISSVALGKDHRDYAVHLTHLGRMYESSGRYSEAEPIYRQAIEIMRAAWGGDNHEDVAASLNNLASLYIQMGNYTDAKPLLEQALTICGNTAGEETAGYGQMLNNLGRVHKELGNYEEAELKYRRAIEIRRNTVGDKHPAYAQSLNDLASWYEETGNFAAAEPLYTQAMEIRRTALGESHREIAESLNNLAGLYEKMCEYSRAGVMFERALEIKRAVLNVNHPDLALSINNLARWHCSVEQYAPAEELFRQALEIDERAFGTDHPTYAADLVNLAAVCYLKGDYGAAEPLNREALKIWQHKLGDNHPQVMGCLSNLGALCAAMNRHSEAIVLLTQAGHIRDRIMAQVLSLASERHRTAFLQRFHPDVDIFLSLVAREFAQSSDEIRSAFDLVLRRKAIGAESLAAQRDALLGGKYPALDPQLREWTTLRSQIAQQTLAGPGPEGLSAHQQLLAQWDQQKERLEAELARQIPEMNLEQKFRAADRRAVALALPEGVALVEFVRFHVFDFQAVPARGESRWHPSRYLAFVLRAEEPDHVQMIDLGEAEPIDCMIRDFRAGITGEAENQAGRDLGGAPVEPARPPGSNHGPALRAAVFDKLVPALAACERLLLAPDGDLTRLPFEVLPTADGHCLIEEYIISYLSCGRDVLRFGVASKRLPSEPLVAADPDFDLGNDGSPAAAPTGIPHGRCSRDLDRGLRFGRLKGTRLEGERIAARLGVKPWLDATALESRLKACRSPRILHVATHGFFLADQKRDPNKEFRDLGTLPGQDTGGLGRLSGSGLENPLLRSGLALAGANTWLQNGNPPAEAEDGLLTAEDVSGLDLLDTDLVVLSACETGLGEVRVGEGVFGLRRAFVLAGAKTLVMSLWKVPDQQTQELMEDFYRRLLEGVPRAEALRQAQLALKARYPNPLYWGAFICQGERGPLPLQPKATS